MQLKGLKLLKIKKMAQDSRHRRVLAQYFRNKGLRTSSAPVAPCGKINELHSQNQLKDALALLLQALVDSSNEGEYVA